MPNRLPAISIEGGAELAALLTGLADKEIFQACEKGLRSVGTKAVRRVRRKMIRGHGLDTGQSKKAAGIRKIKTYKKEGRVVMYLGPRRGFATGAATRAVQKSKGKRRSRIGHDPFYISHLVEFGHKASGWNKGGKDVRPRPTWRPAIDESKSDFVGDMTTKVREVLLKAKAKRGK